jgi:hypothetical protein
MNYLKLTIEKIENSNSIKELENIKSVINHEVCKWSDADKLILNNRIEDALYLLNNQ